MRALATDYDGTIARGGRVAPSCFEALARFRASGGAIVLVTGRELDDLARVCDRLDLFDRIVAENGAVLHDPKTNATRTLAAPPSLALDEALRARGVPFSRGRVVVATREPHDVDVLAAIGELALPLHVVLNKGAVMVLPNGVDKESGLRAALAELGVPLAETVAVGDAENDLPFLRCAGLAVAVANALPEVREQSELVTDGACGDGVVELLARIDQKKLPIVNSKTLVSS